MNNIERYVASAIFRQLWYENRHNNKIISTAKDLLDLVIVPKTPVDKANRILIYLYNKQASMADYITIDPKFEYTIAYANGFQIEQNYEEAFNWYKLSAYQGNVDAQNLLGEGYYQGSGVKMDYKEAYIWFYLVSTKSSGQLYEDACDSINIVGEELTQEQIDQATKEAKEIQRRIDGKG